jgi:hypothetical protein
MTVCPRQNVWNRLARLPISSCSLTAKIQAFGPVLLGNGKEPMASSITFHNLFHRIASVELRAGNFLDCNLNRPLQTILIPAGGAFTLSTDESICFRRDLDPDNPTGQMTVWTTININPPPSSPQTIEVNI